MSESERQRTRVEATKNSVAATTYSMSPSGSHTSKWRQRMAAEMNRMACGRAFIMLRRVGKGRPEPGGQVRGSKGTAPASEAGRCRLRVGNTCSEGQLTVSRVD